MNGTEVITIPGVDFPLIKRSEIEVTVLANPYGLQYNGTTDPEIYNVYFQFHDDCEEGMTTGIFPLCLSYVHQSVDGRYNVFYYIIENGFSFSLFENDENSTATQEIYEFWKFHTTSFHNDVGEIPLKPINFKPPQVFWWNISWMNTLTLEFTSNNIQ